nr:Pig11 [Homo sapiens]
MHTPEVASPSPGDRCREKSSPRPQTRSPITGIEWEDGWRVSIGTARSGCCQVGPCQGSSPLSTLCLAVPAPRYSNMACTQQSGGNHHGYSGCPETLLGKRGRAEWEAGTLRKGPSPGICLLLPKPVPLPKELPPCCRALVWPRATTASHRHHCLPLLPTGGAANGQCLQAEAFNPPS